MTEEKVQEEEGTEFIITVKTVPSSPERVMKGTYKGYIWELLAHIDNTGNIYLGRNKLDCEYPMDAEDVKITRVDLDKLWWKSDNGTEKMHVWGEREHRGVPQ